MKKNVKEKIKIISVKKIVFKRKKYEIDEIKIYLTL